MNNYKYTDRFNKYCDYFYRRIMILSNIDSQQKIYLFNQFYNDNLLVYQTMYIRYGVLDHIELNMDKIYDQFRINT